MDKAKEDVVEELKLYYRHDVVVKWVMAAHDVAKESKLPQALEVWGFINKQTTLGVPHPNGSVEYFFFSEPPAMPIEEFAFLTPVIEQDLARLSEKDPRRSYAGKDPNFMAHFSEGSRAIYFPEDILSHKGKGVILLHEAMHAINEIEKKYDRKDPFSHWVEEAEVYLFEFDVFAALGGDEYEHLVQDCLGRFSMEGKRVNFGHVDKEKAEALWGRVFGQNLEPEETYTWSFVCRLNAFWRFIQDGKDPKAELADYLSKHHQKPR